MTEIQACVFSQMRGWHWEKYMKVQDCKTSHILRKLRRGNPDIEFRADEIETDAEYQQHQRHADLLHRGMAAA